MIDFRYRPEASWTLLCHPDDPHKSLVSEAGALLYGFHANSFDSTQFDRVFEFSAQTAFAPVRVEQATESARRPIVHTTVEYPDQILRLVTFAHEREVRCDVVRWEIEATRDVLAGLHFDGYLRAEALAATVPGPARALHRVPLEPRPHFGGWIDEVPRVDAADGPPALVSTPHPLIGVHASGFRPASAFVTTPVELAAGERVGGALVLPIEGDVTGLDVEDALDYERRYWDGLTLQRLALRVPDADVQGMLESCARNLLQAREIEQGLPVLHVGPTIYRGLWVVDGHFMLEAARYLGLDDVAEAGLDVLLRRVKPDGAISGLADVPHLKETAIAIATLVRQAQLSGDVERLRGHWPVIEAAMAHLDRLRRQAAELPTDHPLHGLMPEAFGDGGLGDSRAEYTTVFWTLIGLKAAGEGARLLGLGERFADELATFREAFERSAARHRENPAAASDAPTAAADVPSTGAATDTAAAATDTAAAATDTAAVATNTAGAAADAAGPAVATNTAGAATAPAGAATASAGAAADTASAGAAADAASAGASGGSGAYLPMAPGSGEHQFFAGRSGADVPRWRRIQPETATWAFCHAIWPGEVFDADAPYVQDLLRLLDARDDEQGIPATTGWLSHEAVWTYAASFAAHAWLFAGRPDKAVDYLYAFANHASPTRVWREEQSLRATGRGQICGDMPHNWASAEFIRLVRHLLVFERGTELELLGGAPEAWLVDGATILVEETPTRFGRVSLDVETTQDRFVAQVSLAAGSVPPDALKLRLPLRFRTKAVVGAETVAPDEDGWLVLAPNESTVLYASA